SCFLSLPIGRGEDPKLLSLTTIYNPETNVVKGARLIGKLTILKSLTSLVAFVFLVSSLLETHAEFPSAAKNEAVTVHAAVARDVSPALRPLVTATNTLDLTQQTPTPTPTPTPTATPTPPIMVSPPGAAKIEQKSQGPRAAARLVESF